MMGCRSFQFLKYMICNPFVLQIKTYYYLICKTTINTTMSDDKQKTLCAHIEEELQVKDPKAYIALIKPATHYCEGCGRSAAKAEKVCKPQRI